MGVFQALVGLFTGGGFADPAEAKQRVSNGAQLVDVRTDGEFAGGHIPGAIHIPVADLGRRHAELDRDKGVVVYCRSGARSARAKSMLEGAGFSDVHNLGPMSAWPAEH